MRILKTIHSLNPATGGVATAVDALSRAEIDLGHTVEVACFDDPNAPWLANRPYMVHAFLPPFFRGYGWCPALSRWLMRNAPRFDVLTVEGLWQHHGPATRAAAHAAGVPYVVYPHGMLDPWFKEAYPLKHLKKSIYWKLWGHQVLRDALAVAFTTEEEQRLAQDAFQPWKARSVLSPLGVKAPGGDAAARMLAWQDRMPALTGRKFLLFLGRIDPKKGADILLQAYASLYSSAQSKNAHDSPPPALVLAGPENNLAFAAHCRELMRQLGLRDNQDVFWTGLLDDQSKWAALEAADAMVLPSHQENFGYVVAEALAVGTPVLISERVNLWREVIADGAGVAAPDDLDGTRRLLAAHGAWTPADRARFSTAAHACFSARFQLEAAARRQIEVLAGKD
jgi:glycosyltransferase involved in cell wall biosynthesis